MESPGGTQLEKGKEGDSPQETGGVIRKGKRRMDDTGDTNKKNVYEMPTKLIGFCCYFDRKWTNFLPFLILPYKVFLNRVLILSHTPSHSNGQVSPSLRLQGF